MMILGCKFALCKTLPAAEAAAMEFNLGEKFFRFRTPEMKGGWEMGEMLIVFETQKVEQRFRLLICIVQI